ncbi:MAG TPA: hypothetical protein DDX84_07395 [Nitrospiraceae bacterium]|nr:MAG: hypothetical protein A2Z60_05535 [Nitrospirae bacterium RIFCSPLOWO2_02_42_7]HBI24008.1 hypothetical protein [Nitrospiraceae bacterium]
MQEQKDIDDVLQLVGFTVGEENFGINISEVHEINRFEQINRLPDLPNYVLGVIDLRGVVIPVINLAEKLGIQSREVTKDTRIIIIGFNEEKVGILVDSVSEVLRVLSNNLEKPPSIIKNVNSEYIRGIIRNNNHLSVILDIQQLFKDYNPLLTKENTMISPEIKSVAREETSDPAIEKIVEVTKAMADGNFTQEIDVNLYGQVGEIARYINATLKKLQSIEPNIAQASDKIPEASMQLSEITKATEEATHSIMGQVERVLDSQDVILHNLFSIEKGNGVQNSAGEIKQIVLDNKETLLDIITGLSFQDLTGQKIKAIISLIEEVEKRVLQLIVTFGLKDKAALEVDSPLMDLSGKSALNQNVVDNLLEEFGF